MLYHLKEVTISLIVIYVTEILTGTKYVMLVFVVLFTLLCLFLYVVLCILDVINDVSYAETLFGKLCSHLH